MMDCRLKADTIAKTVKLLVFMLLKTYSCSLCPSKYCCRRELFENVHWSRQGKPGITHTMVTPSGLIPDQVCTVAETVHTEHPSCLRRAAGSPPELESPGKRAGGRGQTMEVGRTHRNCMSKAQDFSQIQT